MEASSRAMRAMREGRENQERKILMTDQTITLTISKPDAEVPLGERLAELG